MAQKDLVRGKLRCRVEAEPSSLLELRHAAGSDRVVGVQLLEIEVRALARLSGYPIAFKNIKFLGDIAEPGRIQPQADQPALALRLGRIGELGARVQNGVVVEHEHLAALELEAQAIRGRLGDLVEQVEGLDVLVGKGNAELAMAADDAAALITTTELILFY